MYYGIGKRYFCNIGEKKKDMGPSRPVSAVPGY